MRKGRCIGYHCMRKQLRRLDEGKPLPKLTWLDADGYCQSCGWRGHKEMHSNPHPETPRSQRTYDGSKPHDPWG